ncbi:uncharacterized protein SCHCODRAFT_02557280, partial [Schizophyllum commune H4-8]
MTQSMALEGVSAQESIQEHANRREETYEPQCHRSKAVAPFAERPPKPALNRRTRRRLAREIEAASYRVHTSQDSEKPLVELRKHMARPPGSSFLGAKATQAKAT